MALISAIICGFPRGTGTAEACLINGGSGTSGQPTGSITIQLPTRTVERGPGRSATGGLREAVQTVKANPDRERRDHTGGYVPALYAPVALANCSVLFQGTSIQPASVSRDPSFNWDHAFKVLSTASATFKDISIHGGGRRRSLRRHLFQRSAPRLPNAHH